MEHSSKRLQFGPKTFALPFILRCESVVYKPRHIVFSMGDPASHVFYIRKGTVKLSVLSAQGKEAVLAILGEGNFVGEEGLAGERLRLLTATTITTCTLRRIEKSVLVRQLHQDERFADHFTSYLISRTLKVQEDLTDQLFNSTEKRLARALLILAHYGTEEKPAYLLPKISQTTLADMVGTTRPRVNTFMNKFRDLGFIEYNDGLHVNSSLLKVVLSE
jgi:CRP/FNR family cyclic AMP-dependent transcriptional regulator